MATSRFLTFATYNPTGLLSDDKMKYTEQLLTYHNIDFLLIQEHWLLKRQLNKLSFFSSKYNFHAQSGVDEQSQILRGRPYGGCAILWKHELEGNIMCINTSCSRLCAIKIKIKNSWILLINLYLPCDTRSADISELDRVIDDVHTILSSEQYDHILLGGDLNCDLTRSSAHVDRLKGLMAMLDMKWACTHTQAKIDFSFIDNVTLSTSKIDHFVTSLNLFDCITDYTPIHEGSNMSGHSPLVLKLSADYTGLQVQDRIFKPKQAWATAATRDILNYSTKLADKLNMVEIPYYGLTCNSSSCSCDSDSFEFFANNIVQSCLSAANETIPKTGPYKPRCIPGWNEFVEPVKRNADFWHRMWIENGRPRAGAVASVMRKTRLKYHYTIRHVRRNEKEIRNIKMAEAVLANDSREFYKEAKKMCGNKRTTAASVDGKVENKDIAGLFGEQYKNLYNCISYDKHDMHNLWCNINSRCLSETDNTLTCTVSEVLQAVYKLQPGKSDGDVGLLSDHIIHGGQKLYIYLSYLFTIMFKHSFVPSCLLLSTIIPIPKGSGSSNNSNNYRGIALASCLGKIVDRIILEKYENSFCTSDLQFGFKKGVSTNTCTYVFKETVNYYTNENSNVYSVLLDASKAFDRVNFCKLFSVLLDRKLPGNILKFMLNLYTTQKTRVNWNDSVTDTFEVTNGVRQGGVLSPILFTVYIDNLLKLLSSSNVGCYIGQLFVGALAYADDLVILAPTVKACKTLLKICETYADEYNIKFNGDKSYLIVFGKPTCKPEVFLCGNKIPEVKEVKHLGHLISSDLDDDADIKHKRATFIGQVNFLTANFKSLRSFQLLKLFKSYCTSFYGSQTWLMDPSKFHRISASYNIALRQIFKLPYNTHRYILYYLANTCDLYSQLLHRTEIFLSFCLSSENVLVNKLSNTFYYDTSSFLGRNRILARSYIPDTSAESKHLLSLIRELVDCREGLATNGLSTCQTLCMLHYCCTS